MPSKRHKIDEQIFTEFTALAQNLGYKAKGPRGKWKLLQKWIAYTKQHPDLFALPR